LCFSIRFSRRERQDSRKWVVFGNPCYEESCLFFSKRPSPIAGGWGPLMGPPGQHEGGKLVIHGREGKLCETSNATWRLISLHFSPVLILSWPTDYFFLETRLLDVSIPKRRPRLPPKIFLLSSSVIGRYPYCICKSSEIWKSLRPITAQRICTPNPA